MNLKIISDIDNEIFLYISNALESIGDTSDPINIDICSYGGDIFSGVAICEKIREYQEKGVKFNAYIYGIAASAAADIALNCDYIEMAESSSLMVHAAYRMDGKKDRGLDIANKFQLETIQRRNPGFKESDLKSDKWYTSYEALQAGLIDGVFNISTKDTFRETAKLSNIYLAKHSQISSKIGGKTMEETEKKEVLEEKKEDVAAEDIDVADLIERISERLKFIEDRLDKLENGGANAECEKDQRQARFKALYDKISAICAPAQRPEIKVNEATPEDNLKKSRARCPNLSDFAKKCD